MRVARARGALEGGPRASRGVNLIKDLRGNPNNADHQEALRLWMAYSQIETRGQFVRLLGLGASGRNLTRRWEKNPTDAGAQRPGAVSLRRMLYLVVWQMTGVLYISDLDEVDWNRMHVVPRDELKPPVSPFLKVVGGWPLKATTRPEITTTAPPKNIFKLSLRVLKKLNYPYLLRETGLGRLLGLKTHRDMGNAYRWNDGRRQMTQRRYHQDADPVFPILGVFRLKGQPKRDSGIIVRSCKASQSSVYPIRDAILAVNHASCPSLSSSGPPPVG